MPTYTPAAVAKMLGVTVSTVLRWSDDAVELGGIPPKPRPRKYSPEDVDFLRSLLAYAKQPENIGKPRLVVVAEYLQPESPPAVAVRHNELAVAVAIMSANILDAQQQERQRNQERFDSLTALVQAQAEQINAMQAQIDGLKAIATVTTTTRQTLWQRLTGRKDNKKPLD